MASGAAGAAGAGLLLTGRLEGSALVVLALLLCARAASVAVSAEPAAVWGLSMQMRLVPAWIGVLAVGLIRAGSVQLADVRGANAVAGPAVARGSVIAVAAAWVALVAVTIVIAAPGWRADAGAARRLEIVAIAGQVLLVVTLFAGPQVRGWTDGIPWAGASLIASVAVWRGSRFVAAEWAPRVATVLAALGFGLALAGGRL